MTNKLGNVSAQRWSILVREARGAVETLSRCQFQLGDIALEIEPIQPVGGAHGENVGDTLRRFAEEIGEEYATLISLWGSRTSAGCACWVRRDQSGAVLCCVRGLSGAARSGGGPRSRRVGEGRRAAGAAA
jgi:hypothetical protein